jgi:hypothetical protein
MPQEFLRKNKTSFLNRFVGIETFQHFNSLVTTVIIIK